MLCGWTILRKDFGIKLVVLVLPTSNEQWGECRNCSTLLCRPTVNDNSVLMNFDNSSRRKVSYDLEGVHTKVMDVGRNETVFASHLIDQVVY